MRSLALPRSLAAAALLLGALSPGADADVRYLYALMDGAQEVPPVATAATGEGIFVLDDALNTLGYEITYQNLSSAETLAHLHGPAPAGSNAGVLHALPLGTPKVGTWPLVPANVADLAAGLVYANVHTVNHSPGEIRGQLEVVGKGYCFGDGSGTPCPCGNMAGPHAGCRNTTGVGGRLRPAGFPDASGANLRFIGDGLIPGQPALLFAGLNQVSGGAGVQFGDGLRCAGGGVSRLGVKTPGATGRVEWGPGLHVAGGWSPGDVRRLQGWYRDPAGGGVCGNGFNLTNGVEVVIGL